MISQIGALIMMNQDLTEARGLLPRLMSRGIAVWLPAKTRIKRFSENSLPLLGWLPS
jgi:hypothetical protein